MCYTVSALTQKAIKYAEHRGADPDEIEKLEKEIEELQIKIPKLYVGEGFAHPQLLAFTNEEPFKPQMLTWGLIPGWCKSLKDAQKFWNNTLNARGETIFEKPAFRTSAKRKRCLIFVDSFFEYHHKDGKTFPFNISLKSGEPITLGGLWEEWVDKETGEIWKTCSIVTTEGNEMMAHIHNNPKVKGPRMPLILDTRNQDKWLQPIEGEEDKEAIKNLIRPFDQNQLRSFTVGKLKGKEGLGNSPEALLEQEYEELK